MAEDLNRRASVAAKEEVFNHIIIEKHIDSYTDVLHSDKGHRKIQQKKHVLEKISRCSDEGEIARQLVASPCTQQKSQGTLHSRLAAMADAAVPTQHSFVAWLFHDSLGNKTRRYSATRSFVGQEIKSLYFYHNGERIRGLLPSVCWIIQGGFEQSERGSVSALCQWVSAHTLCHYQGQS